MHERTWELMVGCRRQRALNCDVGEGDNETLSGSLFAVQWEIIWGQVDGDLNMAMT